MTTTVAKVTTAQVPRQYDDLTWVQVVFKILGLVILVYVTLFVLSFLFATLCHGVFKILCGLSHGEEENGEEGEEELAAAAAAAEEQRRRDRRMRRMRNLALHQQGQREERNQPPPKYEAPPSYEIALTLLNKKTST